MCRALNATLAGRRARLAALIVVLLLVSGFAWLQLSPAPSLVDPTPPQRAVVFTTVEGEPFARRGEYREAPVNAVALPAHVIAPFIAIEDRRFYKHGGLDLRGIARASLANVRSNSVRQGGSTITQQLAKMACVGNDRSFARKLKEAFVAVRLEAHHSKDQILSAYLSRAYFGDGVYGLGAAARHYFGKDAAELELNEAAMLAGVVNAPSRLAPTLHLDAAQERARIVVGALVDAGYLTPEDAKSLQPARPIAAPTMIAHAGYFADWVQPQIEKRSREGYGRLSVPTTFDSFLQQKAIEAVSKVIGRNNKSNVRQAALVAMRTDGSVVAMVGGRDYEESQFNRAVQAERQPGSAFKLFVYLAALRAGADSQTLIEDRPFKVAGWSPKNFSSRYQGPISLTDAFAQSSNVAAVRLSEHVGRDEVIRAAQDLGLKGDLKPVPSIALGASETTLIDLTSAYAGVAAGTYPVIPTGLREKQTSPLDARSSGRVSMSYDEREALLTMLSAAVETGTGRAARLPIPAFGKTGTTQNARDAWFIGFAGDLIVGVWVGNDDETPMRGVTGGGAPARIWREFMMDALGAEIAVEVAGTAEEAARATEEEQGRYRQQREPDWLERLFEDVRGRQWFT